MPIENELKSETRKEYPPIRAGLYQAEVVDIKDTLRRPYGAPQDAPATEKFLSFHFRIITEGDAKGRMLNKDVRPITPVPPDGGMKASWIWRVVSAIEGRQLNKAEGETFNKEKLNALVGRKLQIMVNKIEKDYKGEKRTYNNITDVIALEGNETSGEIQIDNSDLPF